MDPWPGLRTALSVERAEELRKQHQRTPVWKWRHPVRSWQMRNLCVCCLEPRPCRQSRWAEEILRGAGRWD